jgi:hypothetical protein
MVVDSQSDAFLCKRTPENVLLSLSIFRTLSYLGKKNGNINSQIEPQATFWHQ